MSERIRTRLLSAIYEILYLSDEDFLEGEDTNLRDLGLDSVRFVLLLHRLGIDRYSDLAVQLTQQLTLSEWLEILRENSVKDPA